MRRTGYLLLLPVLAALAVVEIYPIVYTFYLSETQYSTGQSVGIANYAQMFSSAQVNGTSSSYFSITVGSIAITLLYALGSTMLAVVLGILFAFQISQVKRGRWFFESIFLAPLAAAPLVVGVAWAPSGMWDDFNAFWHFALGQPFFNPAASFFFYPAMIFSEAWEWAPLIMLVALGILNGLSQQTYEAAALHGATTWQIFRKVSLPSILTSPVMGFVVVIRFIDSMRAFEIPFAWSAWVSYTQVGSPVDTLSLSMFKLLTTFGYGFPVGYISALAITLLFVTLMMSALLIRIMRRSVKI